MATRPAKKRRLTPPQSDDEESSHRSTVKAQKAFFKNAASWDLEQDYETKARKGKKGESTRLPIKLDGRLLHQVQDPIDEVESVDDEDWLEGNDLSEAESADEPVREEPQIPVKQQIHEAKETLAKIALMVNENPDENAGAFRALSKVGESKIPQILKLTLVTQLSVYKDVIPGYRIRLATEDGPQESKLSKDVRSLRGYEQALVSGYQGYVRDLARHAKGRNQEVVKGQSVASVAITCACTLLTTVSHFNFRNELVKILAGKLSTRRVDEDFTKCLQALQTMFQDDEDGRPSMEAVSLLCKMMRAREYQVDESVINLFLHLRLLVEFSGRASKDHVEQDHGVGPNGKRPKQEKQFRTKRLRKEMKEQKAIDKDMATADASVRGEERDRMMSETLKLCFATFFRILKARAASPHLMGAVLEGLAKFSHLINQDFFGDLLEALKDLIRHSDILENAEETEEDTEINSVRNPTREALLCTITAFALLEGQDAHNARADLHLDLSFFTTHLYQTLLPLSLHPDLELSAKSLHLPDPHAPASSQPVKSTSLNKVNLQTTTVLLIRCLTSVLLPPFQVRQVPPLRLAAYTKQLLSTSLHTPEKSTQAILALLADVGGTHGRKISALWNTEERKGDGTFNPLSESIEGANPFASTIWEGEILRRHYCPKVREGVKIVEKAFGDGQR
ncbi:nucleolar complex-associated protein [Xylariales sp. AK1849]|nr:nucleolar complex-associated protein [Xylariales sp. AK1849]